MADTTYYAWSPIRGGDNDNPITVKRGETVTQSKLKLDDAGWEQLVDSGAIRTMKFPDMPDSYQGSPRDYLLEQARKADENSSELSVAIDLGDMEKVPTADKNTGDGGAGKP